MIPFASPQRLRVVLAPSLDQEAANAHAAPSWPRFDVIDPPAWLTAGVGRRIEREEFETIPKRLAAEGYRVDITRLAWVRAS